MHYLKKLYLAAILSLAAFGANAQNHEMEPQAVRQYQGALDLIYKEKYSAAIEILERLKDQKWDYQTECDYYIAFCSYKLQRSNSTKLLVKFLENHAEHGFSNLAKFHLAHHYFEKRKHKKVLHYLNELDINGLTDKQIIETKYFLGYTHFFLQQFDSAKQALNGIFNIPSKYYYPSNYYLGYMAYLEEDFPKALRHFYVAVESKKYANIAPFYIVQILFIEKQYQKVIDYAENLLTEPNFKYKEETLNLLAQSHFQLKNFQKSAEFLTQYIEQSDEILKSDLYNLAYSQFQLGQFDAASQHFKRLTDSKDSLGQNANYLLAECFLNLGNKEGARNAYEKASKMNFLRNISETAYFNYCKLTYELEYNFQAIESIQNFITSYPYSRYQIEAKDLLASILLNTKNYELALDVLDGVENPTVNMKKALQKVSFYRGVELYNELLLEGALALFSRSVLHPIEPNITAKALYWKGETHFHLGQFKDAAESFQAFTEAFEVADNLSLVEEKAFALYSQGYAHYQLREYAKARIYFNASVEGLESLDESKKKSVAYRKTLPDAKLRLADCHFLTKKYAQALNFYKQVYDAGARGADYALFQAANIRGLEAAKNMEQKLFLLKRLKNKYSWSIYHDDALFELGDTYLRLKNIDSSSYYFEMVEDRHPGSELGRKALSRLALLYLGNNELEQAQKFCTKLLNEYPESQEGKEAINIIKTIYVSKGAVEDLFIILKEQFPDVQFSLDEQDSLSYYAAELQYNNSMFGASLDLFEKYLKQYPDGYFTLKANFYAAQAALEGKKYRTAAKHYEAVSQLGKSPFQEISVEKLCNIYHYKLDMFSNAFKSYQTLLSISEGKANKLIAVRGLMHLSKKLGKYKKLKLYSSTLLSMPSATPGDVIAAQLHLANIEKKEANLDSALVLYNLVKNQSTKIEGVEARYQIAEIYHKKQDFDTSKALCFDIIQNLPNYESWLAKTFILLAKNYNSIGNGFQAKATLQSIIDNFQGDKEIINSAQSVLNDILNEEKEGFAQILDSVETSKNSVLITEEESIQTNYDTLFIEGDTLLIEQEEKEFELPKLDSIKVDSLTPKPLEKDTILNPVDTLKAKENEK